MYKFDKTKDSWEQLEELLCKKYPRHEIHYVCRMKPELEKQGFQVLTIPDFDFDGCEYKQYRALMISPHQYLPKDFTRVINYPDSYSGSICLDQWLAKQNLQEKRRIQSESHIESVRALLDGRADLASIDCISWGYIKQELAEVEDLHIIDRSPLIQGHPIIIKGTPEVKFELSPPLDLLKCLHLKSL